MYLAAAAAFAQTPAPTNGFVGSNACKTCHADIWSTFYRNPHYQALAAGDRPPDQTGCESCHGPAQDHVAAHGGKTTIPRAFSLMDPKQTLDACLTCHAKDLQKSNIRRSEHTINGVVCTNCHSIHHSPSVKFLLAKARSETCFACHASARAVRNALQTPRQRGLYGLLGLSQSPRHLYCHLAHGNAAAHGGSNRFQR